jgi:hypothetical protein
MEAAAVDLPHKVDFAVDCCLEGSFVVRCAALTTIGIIVVVVVWRQVWREGRLLVGGRSIFGRGIPLPPLYTAAFFPVTCGD